MGAETRHRVEVLHPLKVNVVDLPVPGRHGEEGGLRPYLRAAIHHVEADLLHEFSCKSVLPALADLDSAAWVGPEAPGQVEPGPVESHEQDRVVLVEDQPPDALTQVH